MSESENKPLPAGGDIRDRRPRSKPVHREEKETVEVKLSDFIGARADAVRAVEVLAGALSKTANRDELGIDHDETLGALEVLGRFVKEAPNEWPQGESAPGTIEIRQALEIHLASSNRALAAVMERVATLVEDGRSHEALAALAYMSAEIIAAKKKLDDGLLLVPRHDGGVRA